MTLSAGTADGAKIATDDAGVPGHVQLFKIAISSDGSATLVPADTANGLDVDVTRLPALVTGDAVVGRVKLTDGTDVALVTGAGELTVTRIRPATSTLSNVSGSASNVTVLASNANRIGATIANDSTAVLYLKLGATASSTSFTVKMDAGAYYELPQPVYTGIIDGIWASATGAARVTELTA